MHVRGKTRGGSIYQLRLSLHLNQAEFGKRLGVQMMAVSRWERDWNEPPAATYIKMAKMSTTKAEFWQFLDWAGLAKSELSAAAQAARLAGN